MKQQRTVPPDLDAISNDQPDLSVLPKNVADRIRDMWTVGSILGHYFHERHDCRRLREGLKVFHARYQEEAMRPLRSEDDAGARSESAWALYHHYTSPRKEEEFDPDRLEDIDTRVQASHAICNRLALESELVFLQMALDLAGSKNEMFNSYPLLDCLRRVRNLAVHHRSIGLRNGVFHGRIDTGDHTGINIRVHHSWYYSVTANDLDCSRPGPCPPELARWFVRQCGRLPSWWILTSAVEQICDYFSKKGRKLSRRPTA